MTATTAGTVSHAESGGLPSTLRIGIARGGVELRQFFRQRAAVVFVFALPAVLLSLFSSILHESGLPAGMSEGQLIVGGMVAAGIVSTSFLNMGIGIAQDRDDRTLKRLRGTPMPLSAYFVGKLVLVAVTGLAETVLLLAVGRLFFHVTLPATAGQWVTFAWVFALGTVGCTLLGIAASGLSKSARSAPAVLNLIFLVLEFMSGVFIVPINTLPRWMIDFASLFPLKWTAQGMRSVFLPDGMMSMEAAGTWEHVTTALVLSGWCVAGLVLCLLTFRWTNRRDG
ncbi:MAG TPA: ABC transporter permease [Pseudonocardiaceae bacterium]|jgi:ABC-2 type transport system permease protein|nr:ABC transporter permease [Pseudonocardiaceae bacterium]